MEELQGLISIHPEFVAGRLFRRRWTILDEELKSQPNDLKKQAADTYFRLSESLLNKTYSPSDLSLAVLYMVPLISEIEGIAANLLTSEEIKELELRKKIKAGLVTMMSMDQRQKD